MRYKNNRNSRNSSFNPGPTINILYTPSLLIHISFTRRYNLPFTEVRTETQIHYVIFSKPPFY